MYGLHWSESLSLVLFWVVCAIAGALILMQRLSATCRYEKQFGLSESNWSGAIIGGLGGAGVASIGIYFYFLRQQQRVGSSGRGVRLMCSFWAVRQRIWSRLFIFGGDWAQKVREQVI